MNLFPWARPLISKRKVLCIEAWSCEILTSKYFGRSWAPSFGALEPHRNSHRKIFLRVRFYTFTNFKACPNQEIPLNTVKGFGSDKGKLFISGRAKLIFWNKNWYHLPKLLFHNFIPNCMVLLDNEIRCLDADSINIPVKPWSRVCRFWKEYLVNLRGSNWHLNSTSFPVLYIKSPN